ncbi:polyphosphate kinase 1 [Bacteroidota bacterium]
MSEYKYFNRDLSWLSFNYRVLQEAYDRKIPLYERIKFMAIFSNNLEEFYRVRVSYYRALIQNLSPDHEKIERVNPKKVIHQINAIVSKQQGEFNNLFYLEIIPELKKNGIILVDNETELTEDQEEFIEQTFNHDILPSIQPVLLVRKKVRPFLKTGQIYLVLNLYTHYKTLGSASKVRRPKYGIIKLPTDHNISRFIELPEKNDKYYIMFLEDLLMRHVNKLFPGYHIDSWYSFKVTRDADLEYEDYDQEDLIEVIENIENTRAIGAPNRFQYDARIPSNVLKYLIETFGIDEETIVQGGRTHNYRDFFAFPNPLSPRLENKKFKPLKLTELELESSIFRAIEKKEYMLHFPYQSFDYFIRFLNEAAYDESVEEIKTTQYRVARNSAVVEALINAALNGKKVTVFVELKARFDEEANLKYAREMKQAGIKIIYSIPKLKVHSKLAIVVRKENLGKSLAFLGTGNFNEKTARLYCDHGFFTTDEVILSDLKRLFSHFEDQTVELKFKEILVPNYNMIETYKELIDNEIRLAREGKSGYILLKMNGLEDTEMISKLYEASENGVKVDCIIRGICCLIPNQPYSKNIRVIRIVDRFLEHARIFVFQNNGNHKIYMGSADWMKRNLYRRIECVFPIKNIELKKEILDLLKIQLSDNTSARIVDENMENVPVKQEGPAIRTQEETYRFLQDKLNYKIEFAYNTI